MTCKCGKEMADLSKYWGHGDHDYHMCPACNLRFFDGEWVEMQNWQNWFKQPPLFTHEYGMTV